MLSWFHEVFWEKNFFSSKNKDEALIEDFHENGIYNDTRVGDIIHKLLLDIHYTIDIESKIFYEKETKNRPADIMQKTLKFPQV